VQRSAEWETTSKVFEASDNCVATRDITIDGATAFYKGNYITLLRIQPDPKKPENRYVAYSELLRQEVNLGDEDIIRQADYHEWLKEEKLQVPEETHEDLRKPLKPLRGGLLSAVLLVLGLLLSILLFSFAFFFALVGVMPLVVIVCAVSLAIPFLFGVMLGRGAWLLALSYAVLMVFVGAPVVLRGKYMGYIWASSQAAGPGAAIAVSYTVLALACCFLGATVRLKGKGSMRRLERPVLSVAPILILCVLASVSTPFIQDAVSTSPSRTYTDKKYGFQVTMPEGWSSLSTGTPNNSNLGLTNHHATWTKFNNQTDIRGWIYLDISVFKKLPFDGTDVASFMKPIDCYRALVDSLKKNSVPEGSSGFHPSDYSRAEVDYLQVDGKPAMRMTVQSPSNRDHEWVDIYVLGSKYLYKIECEFSYSVSQDSDRAENKATSKKVEEEILGGFNILRPEKSQTP
jgi:hypothetical protein